ncbi:MAG: hypothetical protein ACI9Y1_002228 [Lentisphaeria bacterium]|jgi:hypothetical protein
MAGAWALMLLHDHYYGIDFGNQQMRFKFKMDFITRENVDEKSNLLDDKQWGEIAFKSFSKVYYKAIK